MVLRPGKTPSGVEVRAHLRRLVRRIRVRWPRTGILFRGDSPYARPEAMAWCERNDVDYVFGLAGSATLSHEVEDKADAERTERAVTDKPGVRGHAATLHKAKFWNKERRALAKAEFDTLRLRLLKIAASVIETANRVRIAFAAARPEADLFRSLPRALMPAGP